MSAVSGLELAPLPEHRTSVRTVEDIAGLSALYEDGLSVITLPRRLDDGVLEEVGALLSLPSFRLLTSASPADGAAPLVDELRGFPRLAAELHFWTEVLAELTGCASVGVRLARVEAAMCPRFHVDRVLVRVVSTYAGLGTEFLAGEDADRRWLGHAARGASDETSGLLRGGAVIRQARTGDVVLLKGEAWPGNTGRGAIHRSPRASHLAPRLVMTLDPL